ncbi:MAG: alpha/beta hydrolase [Thermoanaerobaculia bacterium]|nr:alpha/beta hydrolase [Thermoanaerobaculia bacterium]
MTTPAGRSGRLEIAGQQIFWEHFGEGEREGGRETVVLLNGLAMHTRAWYGFLDELLPTCDVLLYDYLGQGESSSPDAPLTIPELAGHLATIADHLAIAKLHVVGLSYGGFVALDFARLFPERLLTLTLSGILLSRERQFEMYQDMSLRFYRGGPELFELYTRYLYEKIFGEAFLRGLPTEDLEAMRERFVQRYRHRIHSLIRLTEAQNPFFDGLESRLPEYRAVSAPVLVVAGAEDRAIPPRMQRKIAEVFPRCRYEELAGSGHVVHLEKRRQFFDILRIFLRTKSLAFEMPTPEPEE